MKMLRNLKLYFRYSAQNIRGLMEYKNDFIVSTIAGGVWQAVGLVFLFALFHNITSVAGWNMYEVSLLYGCVMFSEGAYTLLFQGSTGFKHRIRNGEFDRYILRPVNLTTQILGAQINFAGLCTLITACSLMVYAVRRLSLDIHAGMLFLFGINLLLGVCIRVNMELMGQSIAFCLINVSNLQNILYDVQNFAKYPLTIYPKAVRVVLVTVLPHAMISYVPVCLLLGRLALWPYILGVPCSAVFITWLRRLIFNKAITKYESAGN